MFIPGGYSSSAISNEIISGECDDFADRMRHARNSQFCQYVICPMERPVCRTHNAFCQALANDTHKRALASSDSYRIGEIYYL